MSTSSKVRLAMALVLAVAFGVTLWQDQISESNRAQALLANGQRVNAEITNATIKSKKKWGVTTSRHAEVDYQFVAADGQGYSGRDKIDAALVDAMTDAQNSSILRDDASIEIVYLPSEPRNNGSLAQLTSHREPDYYFPLFGAAIIAAVVWFASGRILGFFGRRQRAGAENA